MTDSRMQVVKLGNELGVDAEELAFLLPLPADTVRDLRHLVAEAVFARHEARFLRLAKVSGIAPPGITAKIAEAALGPLLAARTAAVMRVDVAVQLASKLRPDFLTDLTVRLDPTRAEPIVRALPADLVVDVGRRLLERGDFLTLGRFVAIVDTEISLRVVETADDEQLLEVALFTEDEAALEAVVAALPDDRVSDVLAAASDRDQDLATLLASASGEARARLERLLQTATGGGAP